MRGLVNGIGPRQYCRVRHARSGSARKCAAAHRHTACEGPIPVRPRTAAMAKDDPGQSGACINNRPGTRGPVARCPARSTFYPVSHFMVRPQVDVRREKNRLLCGVVTCDGVVGYLAADVSGWPRAILTRKACPRCGLDQILSFAKLEADTQAQYIRR